MAKMQQLYGEHFEFIQNDCTMVENIAICGTRGWVLPSAENFTAEDEKIYKREALRLELSLEAACKHNPAAIIVAMHYPPLFAADEHTLFTDLMEKHHVNHCVYGHIHGENHVLTFEGEREGVNYKLVSCDTQGFALTCIL